MAENANRSVPGVVGVIAETIAVVEDVSPVADAPAGPLAEVLDAPHAARANANAITTVTRRNVAVLITRFMFLPLHRQTDTWSAAVD
jgi:hypothetical protein